MEEKEQHKIMVPFDLRSDLIDPLHQLMGDVRKLQESVDLITARLDRKIQAHVDEHLKKAEKTKTYIRRFKRIAIVAAPVILSIVSYLMFPHP